MSNSIPTTWNFLRNSGMPIIEVIGQGPDKCIEREMVNVALDIIKTSEKFKGKPYPAETNFKSNAAIAVTVSIIFPSETELMRFMEHIISKNASNP